VLGDGIGGGRGKEKRKSNSTTACTNIPHQCIVKFPAPNASLQKHFCPALLLLKIKFAASFNQLLRDGSMPTLGRNHFLLKIYVTTSFNQLLRDGSMPILSRDVERRTSTFNQTIKLTASFNQLLKKRR
jgi:hypothetical protein